MYKFVLAKQQIAKKKLTEKKENANYFELA